jgi:hypothetical protein
LALRIIPAVSTNLRDPCQFPGNFTWPAAANIAKLPELRAF